MRHDHILEFLVDLHDLELHHAVNKHVVVADGLNVDLRARQEGFDAEHFDDEATLGAALDVTVDDFALLVGFVDAVPRLEQQSLLVRKDELTVGAFLVLDIDFHLVAHLQVGVGAELRDGDDAVRLKADVNDHLTRSDGHHSAFDDLVVNHLAHRTNILLFELLTLVGGVVVELLVRRIPIEIFSGNGFLSGSFGLSLNRLFSGFDRGFNDRSFLDGSLINDVFFFFHCGNCCCIVPVCVPDSRNRGG